MQELGIILSALMKVWWLFLLIGTAGIVINQVRLNKKVLFNKEGDVRVVTVVEKDKLIEDEKKKYELLVTEIKDKIDTIKFSHCPDHETKMAVLSKVENRQLFNVEKLESIEETVQEGAVQREEMSKKLTTICVNIASISSDIIHMANDIKELKQRGI